MCSVISIDRRSTAYQKAYRILSISLLAGLAIYSFFLANRSGDFQVFLEAGKLLKSGENPYHQWLLNKQCLYFYSPLWAILISPFTEYAYLIKLLWLLTNVFFLHRIWRICQAQLSIKFLSSKQQFFFLLLLAVCTHRFVLYNFMMIQMTIFIVWAILESLGLFDKKKLLAGALILALAINIKLLALVALPYLIYRGYFKAFGLTVLFLLIYLLLPSVYLGWERNVFLHQQWWSVINPSTVEHLFDTELGPHDLSALIPNLLMETSSNDYTLRRHILTLSLDNTLLILNVFRGGLIVLTVYFLGTSIFKKRGVGSARLKEISYLLLIVPLIFPHQQKYAFFFAFPAVMFLLKYLFTAERTPKKTAVWVLFLLSFTLMTLTSDAFIGRDLNKLTQFYKLITYGTLLLIPALILAESQISKTQKEYPERV